MLCKGGTFQDEPFSMSLGRDILNEMLWRKSAIMSKSKQEKKPQQHQTSVILKLIGVWNYIQMLKEIKQKIKNKSKRQNAVKKYQEDLKKSLQKLKI